MGVLYSTVQYCAVLCCTEDWVQVSWPLPTDAKLSPQGGDTALGGGEETLPAPLAAVSSLRFLLTTPDSHHYLSLSPHYSLYIGKLEQRLKILGFSADSPPANIKHLANPLTFIYIYTLGL